MAWVEKLPSGKWVGRYRDTKGVRRSAGTFAHKAAALRAANVKEEDVRRSMRRNPDAHRQTWGDWCETWWPSRAIEASTEKRDRSRREQHLKPRWSDVPLGQITRHDVKAWAADLRRSGLSNSTVLKIVALFSASLNAAVDAEILTANPALRLKLPPAAATKDRYLEHDEHDAIVAYLPTLEDQLIAHTLAYAGLRIGELSALRRNRVITAHGRGRITVAESYDDETSTFKPYPKGKRPRSVPIDDWLCELFEDHFARHPGKPGDLVFFSPQGGVLRRSNWDNVFRSSVEAAAVHLSDGGAGVTIHVLRHTFCSWLVIAGISLARVQELAGHESAVTTQRYAHLAPVNHDEIHAALGRPRELAPVVRGEVVGGGRGAAATHLPHADVISAQPGGLVARSEAVGPVGLEPTTRGLKDHNGDSDQV